MIDFKKVLPIYFIPLLAFGYNSDNHKVIRETVVETGKNTETIINPVPSDTVSSASNYRKKDNNVVVKTTWFEYLVKGKLRTIRFPGENIEFDFLPIKSKIIENTISVHFAADAQYLFGVMFNKNSILQFAEVDSNNPHYDSRNNCNAVIYSPTNELVIGTSSTVIPEGVTSIGEEAFAGRKNLKKIKIPYTVKVIEEEAFRWCDDLDTVIFETSPDGKCGLEEIQGSAFVGCDSLKHIQLPSTLKKICRGAFKGTNLTEIVIPEKVDTIEGGAFSRCNRLSRVSIPASVKYLGGTFLSYSNVDSIIVDSGNPFYDSRNNCNAVIDSRSGRLIAGSSSTVIPEGVTSIGPYAFAGRKNLRQIFIPASVKHIENNAFSDCTNLINIVIDSNNPYYYSKKNKIYNKKFNNPK